MSGGAQTTVASYTSYITPGQSYEVEARHKDGAVKIYLENSLLYKATNVSASGKRLGVGTVSGNASFSNTLHKLGAAETILRLTPETGNPPTPGPVVQITSPLGGSAVSGSLSVTATASDPAGITSVQFMLNNSPLGAADMAAPYSATWDTSLTNDGTHQLTAVATNPSGISATSSPVSVTVVNSTPPVAAEGFTINSDGPNAGLDLSHTTSGAAEWRLASRVTPESGGTGPRNYSLVFNHADTLNYYYASFSAAPGLGLSGVYRVTNGVAQKLLGYDEYLAPGQAVDLEIRYKNNTVRLYLNGTYFNKSEGITGPGGATGVLTHDANAVFENTRLKIGSASYAALALSPVNLTSTPENPYPVCPPRQHRT